MVVVNPTIGDSKQHRGIEVGVYPTDDQLRAMKRDGEPLSRLFQIAHRCRGLGRNEVREIVFGAAR